METSKVFRVSGSLGAEGEEVVFRVVVDSKVGAASKAEAFLAVVSRAAVLPVGSRATVPHRGRSIHLLRSRPRLARFK